MTNSHDQQTSSTSQHGAGVKTLAIRLDGTQHAQLTMLAQLDELNITTAIRQAIDQWIETKRSDPKLTQRAEAALAEIEQDATSRRQAIAALLSNNAPSATKPTETSDNKVTVRSGRAKGGQSAHD